MTRNNKNGNNIKNNITSLVSNIKFKSLNLTLAKQIILLGIFIGFISLYLPWINDVEKSISRNSFYSITGNIGYLLIIVLLIPVLIIFSTNYKEKIKLYSDLSVKNHFLVITSAFIIISFSIVSLSFINGLNTFFENIFYGKGVILCMTAGFIIMFGGFLLRKEYYSDSSEIILNKLNQNRENLRKEDNMKLPF